MNLLMIALLLGFQAQPRDEWFRSLDLQPVVTRADLVMVVRVSEVSETKIIRTEASHTTRQAIAPLGGRVGREVGGWGLMTRKRVHGWENRRNHGMIVRMTDGPRSRICRSFVRKHRASILSAIVTGLLIGGGPLPAGDAFSRSDRPPNIILCMTDDHGWGDVGYNGLKRIRTPALDAMAAAGLRFNRFYAQQSCSPTRASVMTGRHPNRMGVFWPGMPLKKEEITLAQAVKGAGFATGHFGKWHLNGVAGPGKVIPDSDPLSPRNVGFDESFSVSNYFELDWTFGRNGVPEKAIGDGSEAIVAEALKFIGQASEKKKPFFAVIWFGSPHVPHKPLPADLATAGGSGYYGELVAMDRSVGTLRAGLRKLGVADDTMVWFCGDNGGFIDPVRPDAHGSNGGLRGRKAEMWEGGIRVPCVIEWPARIKLPSATDIPSGVVDIYPTVVDLLQLKVPDQVQPLDGISLAPLLDGLMKERPRPLGFWQYNGSKPMTTNSGPSAWNDNRYKLVKQGPEKYALFDLAADLSETNDVAPQHPEITDRMKVELENWQRSVLRSNRGEDYQGR